MAASITFSLPFETVAAVQRAEGLEKALQDLSLTQTPEDSVIYDIARRVVNQVNALSYVPVPNSLDAPSGAMTESGKVYRSEDGTPTPTPHLTTTFDGNQHTAAGPSTTPASPYTSVSTPATYDPNLPVASTKRPGSPNNEAIHITIVDHATDEKQDMVAFPEDTFVTVTQRYTSMVGRTYHNMTFSFEDGDEIPLYALGCNRFQAERIGEDADCALTFRMLGITNQRRNVIHACEGTIEITVSNPTDLSSHDEIFGFPVATQFGKLARRYAERIGTDVYELKFSTLRDNVESEVHSDFWRQSLHQLDISHGDTITVKPNMDDSHDMTFTLRYAMHKTTSITLASTETVSTLDRMVDRSSLGAKHVYFDLEGYVFSARSQGNSTIEGVFVTNGAVLDVRPYKWSRQTLADRARSYTREDYADDDTAFNCSPGGSIRQTQAENSKYSNLGIVAESGDARCVSPDSDTHRIFQDYARDQDPMVKWQQSQLASDAE
ncbi:hypothetical protein LTR12_006408 [Friedmanniomyces endolithicus]|nr:hypothetical protein LTR74_001506 [Friedmanniomyces endolithicus]KAK1819218.1 hypothetical protein LTR12_006408 [Friedmanniomyces endolithicus]